MPGGGLVPTGGGLARLFLTRRPPGSPHSCGHCTVGTVGQAHAPNAAPLLQETQQSVQPCEQDPERDPEQDPEQDPERTCLARALRGTLDSTGLGRQGREGSMGAPLCGPGRRRQLCARSLQACQRPATREEVGVSRRSWSLAVVLAHLTPLAQESWIQSKETQNPKKWVCPQTHHFTISSTSRDQEINNKVTRVWQPQAWPPPTWGFPSSG